MENRQRISVFFRQCFVVTGVILNMAQYGLVYGFTSNLLPQLRKPDSSIHIDDFEGSWIAAIPALTSFLSSFVIPSLMGRCGRKVTNLFSVIPMIIGWFVIAIADNFAMLLIARLLQGFSMGVGLTTSPIIISECTSPANRGMFLTVLSLAITIGTHAAHTMGSLISWQVMALVCVVFTFLDLLIVIYSPESPSWLIFKGKYEDGRTVFRWLRGEDQEDELNKMIEANVLMRQSETDGLLRKNEQLKSKFVYLMKEAKKPEFYKPIFIMTHLCLVVQFSGVILIASYAVDISEVIIGRDIDVNVLIFSADTSRLISSVITIYFIMKFKRKSLLITMLVLNIFAYIATAGYSFATSRNIIPNYPSVGIFLILIHVVSLGLGVPVPMAIIGEIIPLKYRSIASMINGLITFPVLFITTKTVPFLMDKVGLHGMYCIHGGALCYSLVASLIFLTETKDKTLQDIEDEFVGKKTNSCEITSEKLLSNQ